VLSLPGLPLSYAMALVAASDLFLGVDSCMLHAADFHRVPGVGLFGPTSPRRWGFRFGPHRHVAVAGAIDQIGTAEVLAALESLAP
jgi:ADP-heptose:LPS heptosyltransferase